MQTVTMVDMGAAVSETITPVKSASNTGQDFSQAMSEAQQPSAEQATVATGPKSKEAGTQVSGESRPEAKAESIPDQGQTATAEVGAGQSEVDPSGLQQEVGDLLQVLSGAVAELEQGETLEGASAALSGDAVSDIDTLITQLVETLDTQLEDGVADAELLVGGIDLTALIDTLEEFGQLEEPQAAVTELVSQISEQLQQGLQTGEQGAAIAAQLDGTSVATTVPLAENLNQARQKLQTAIDSAVASVKGEVVATETTTAAAAGTLLDGAEESIDPRFAGLLSVRQTAQGSGEAVKIPGTQTAATSASETAVSVEGLQAETELKPQGLAAQLGQQQGQQGKTDMTQLNAQQPNLLAGQGQAPLDAGRNAVALQQVLTLSSGTQVSEGQIFDQVVTHISGSATGETGRMVVRLNPAELGNLRLDLQVEGDKVRANLHAQTQQVQEVIERNLPQLRNALAEQGLKIDQFEVTVDQQQTSGEFAQQQDSEQQSFAEAPDWQQDEVLEDQAIPLGQLMQNAGGGISVHV